MARQLGLDEADAADAAQDTLACFLSDYRAGKFDRSRGRLRAWLLAIARHRVIDFQRRRAARRVRRGNSAIADVPDEQGLSAIWDAECRQKILSEALARLGVGTKLQPQTITAFRQQVIEERPPEQVAAELGLSVRAVYLAKHRCLSRLRQIIEELTRAYEIE